MRKIIHCDCDSFYASVEMRDNPTLRSQPIAVGGKPSQRGVVATCNYLARQFGVRSAMPMSQAVRLCPALVVVPTNMSKYRRESSRVQAIFKIYTKLVEPLSLDEAFLDVSDSPQAQGSATLIAEEIRDRVRSEIGITVSAGIAPNKFLAKIASDWNKPDGQLTIAPREVETFVAALPVEKLFGVGSVTAKRMHKMGIRTCSDLQQIDIAELTRHFGKFGVRLYELSRGIDERPVNAHRQRKSVSAERTYPHDLPDLRSCQGHLPELLAALEERIERADCRNLITQRTVKIRFSNFTLTTLSQAGQDTQASVYEAMLQQAWERGKRPVRLLGVGVSLSSRNSAEQFALF